ncbi:C4-dicarboxylic acid transporter DauA [Ketobacter sp.]|uniref:C4-dicarboxylic acid transporter DauA n=1 Tax=Ketobacter sp. TaxID=2083498 RepID=UPI000F2D6BB7|nr:C4-dicarboxylic acid transporter DauA [Ketobacter sp.]RLT97459.1 MAG: C4-dicarboxylic acid transporter DauA [Ketobacter sp.]
MPNRAHLFSLRIAHAMRESCLQERYGLDRLRKDALAGVAVGIIAIPLAMALAIASGVAPQYGLYTAIVAGLVIALTGGSRFSISGPTAAFVVILYPVAQQHGFAGLLMSGLLAGCIMVGMALLRLGRYIEYIPEPVTLGFTGGIAIVIATLQVRDFGGLAIEKMPESYLGKLFALAAAIPDASWANLLVGAVTLLTLLVWLRVNKAVPPHLPAVVIGSVLAWGLSQHGVFVDTIGTRFHYELPDGSIGNGIPPFAPHLDWPWSYPGAQGVPFELSLSTIEALLPGAFAIAMLGAIESLLCAVVLDGMTGKRHSANSELLGQGIGNIVTPFFGGITATAAIARSAANVKAGAQSPVAACIHGMVVLAAIVLLAPLLAYLPMASMAALLLMVAWNMSEAPKALHLLRTAPAGDVLVFITCLSLTVLFDMVIAIAVGIVLASLLFMREIATMTQVKDITRKTAALPDISVPDGWQVFQINGPLFFAAADRVFGELSQMVAGVKGVVLYMDAVPLLDAGGLSALQKFLALCRNQSTQVVITDLQFAPLRTLRRAELQPVPGALAFASTLEEALKSTS